MNAWTVIYAIWLREYKIFMREKIRVIGMIGQPLLYLLIVGKGITAGMKLNATGNIDYLKFMYPGIIGMSILFTSVFSAISIIWDREFGFLKEVLVAPVPRWGVAIGKSLGGATISLIQCVILICLAPVAGIDLSPFVVVKLLVLAFLLSFSMTSFGVILASRMSSMQSFQMVWNFLVMPLYFLSGAMFPMSSAPGWLKTMMALDPMTYGVDAIRNVVFSGTIVRIGDEAGVPLRQVAYQAGLIHWSLSTDLLVMLLSAIVLGTLGAWSFSRSQAS